MIENHGVSRREQQKSEELVLRAGGRIAAEGVQFVLDPQPRQVTRIAANRYVVEWVEVAGADEFGGAAHTHDPAPQPHRPTTLGRHHARACFAPVARHHDDP